MSIEIKLYVFLFRISNLIPFLGVVLGIGCKLGLFAAKSLFSYRVLKGQI